MNKILSIVCFVIAACSAQGALAGEKSCLGQARVAAFKTARPNGNRPNSDLVVSIGRSELVGQQGNNLLYKVEIDYDVLDGASSDSFPPKFYAVQAIGNLKSCQIIAVKLVN